MSEIATITIPPTGLGRIMFWRDLGKGLYYACAGQLLALVSYIGDSILQEHPHFPNTWIEWLPYVKNIAYAASGYVIAKFGVNNIGQIGKKNKPVVLVSQKHLEEKEKEIEELKQKVEEIKPE